MIDPLATSDRSLLFVYGTLRRGCVNDEARRLHEECAWIGTARAGGRLCRVDWYPALVVASNGEWVIGDVLRMTKPNMTLAWLDGYEECGPAFPRPQEYRREMIEVELAGAETRAWAYLYNRPIAGLTPILSGDWLCSRPLSSQSVDQPDSRER